MTSDAILLRFHDRDVIAEATRDVAERVATGALDRASLNAFLRGWKLRAPRGAWWTVNPADGRWYRWEDSRWVAGRSKPVHVEGPCRVPGVETWLPAPASADATDPTGAPKDPSSNDADPIAVLREEAREVLEAYRKGATTSAALEQVLSRPVLFDDALRFWWYGPHSHRWYAFEDGRWRESSAPPARNTLRAPTVDDADDPDDEEREALRVALGAFLADGLSALPEPVIEPWDPPAEHPARVRECEVCRAVALGATCPRCGDDESRSSTSA